ARVSGVDGRVRHRGEGRRRHARRQRDSRAHQEQGAAVRGVGVDGGRAAQRDVRLQGRRALECPEVRRVPYTLLGDDPEVWPPVEATHSDGILAFGGDLKPQRLLAAYARGIFPWYSEGLPILWNCPDPRFVLEPARLHVPKSLEKNLRRGVYQVKLDTAFEAVIDGCAKTKRPGQRGTWITRDMRAAYLQLHRL